MSSSSSTNFFGMYGQSPRHAAALYTDARDSMRQASSSSPSRRSMQSSHSMTSSLSSHDYEYDEPQRPSAIPENANTPPPPYSCRASVLPETLPAPSFATSESHSIANSAVPSSRAQKRRSSVMIKDLGKRILCTK